MLNIIKSKLQQYNPFNRSVDDILSQLDLAVEELNRLSIRKTDESAKKLAVANRLVREANEADMDARDASEAARSVEELLSEFR